MKTKKIKLGRVGLVPKGAYSPDATYGRMHVVTYKNTTYWSKQEGNTGHEPLGEDEWWGILVDGQAAYAGAYNANEAAVRANKAAKEAERTNSAVWGAERERESAETERNQAEEQRKAQAQSMAEAEQSRADAEQGRVEAESQRVEAEERRASEETLRAAAEDTRKSDEADRIAGETSREQQEDSRVAAEQTRDADEAQRKIDETKRAGAETKRADAEDARKEAETGRVSAETERAAAETARAKAETARADAETKRAAAETKRETDFSAKVEEVDTAVTNAKTATAEAEKVDATITEANVFEVTGRDGVKKSLGLVGQAEAATIKTDLKKLEESNTVTYNVADKVIDLPSDFGIIKQKYLHVENRVNTNENAQLYCIYINKPCKISASNLANMQDGYSTRCWAAYSEREINNEYLVSELSDSSGSPRRTGVSCELDIPNTVKMICFSSVLSEGKPIINFTAAVTNDELTSKIEGTETEINDKITKNYTYSGSSLADIVQACYYRLGIGPRDSHIQGYLYYPRKGVSVSIRNITSNGNACPAIVCFKEKIEITPDVSANYTNYAVEGWNTLAIVNNTRSYENLTFPEEVKMIYIYSPKYNNLEIIEHVGVMEEIASAKEEVTSVKEPSILTSTDNVVTNGYDFDEQPIIAKFFADRITHRNKYIDANSRKVYWSLNNGNDDNDGLTESTAVKSYSKVSTLLSNGSELYIERGSVITELCKFYYQGLLIDTYGSEVLDNPIFDNFALTDSSEWKQVEGYEHIYKLTRHLEASGANINSVQVAVDGHNIADIYSAIFNGGTYPVVSNCTISSKSDALTRLSEHVNEAWCSCYEGGYSWEEGDYDIYISLSDSPSEHKIEVINHVVRCLIEFGDYCDIRHVNTRGSAGKDGWNIAGNTYMEDCHIYDHCHHGFLQGPNGGIMRMYNCSAEAPRGAIGYQFHIFAAAQKNINNKTDMFIDCKSVSKGMYGSCISGHGSTSMSSGLDVYVINCEANGNSLFIGDTSLMKHLYVKGCRVNEIITIGSCASDATIFSDIKGTITLKNRSSIFTYPGNLRASNLVLRCKSLNGISGIFYKIDDTSFNDINSCSLRDCKFSIDKIARDSINPAQSYNIFRGYKGANFTNCLFVVTVQGAQDNDESLYYPINKDYGVHNFDHCLFFGTKDNSTSSVETNKFLKIADIPKIEYIFNRLYTDNGVLKLFE